MINWSWPDKKLKYVYLKNAKINCFLGSFCKPNLLYILIQKPAFIFVYFVLFTGGRKGAAVLCELDPATLREEGQQQMGDPYADQRNRQDYRWELCIK